MPCSDAGFTGVEFGVVVVATVPWRGDLTMRGGEVADALVLGVCCPRGAGCGLTAAVGTMKTRTFPMASTVRRAGGDVVPLPLLVPEPQLLLVLESFDRTSLLEPEPILTTPPGTDALEHADGTVVEASACGVACPVGTG